MTRNKRRLARYLLRPRYVDIGGEWNDITTSSSSSGTTPSGSGSIYIPNKATEIAAGESHAVVVLDCGGVVVWGQNSCGQLGIGISPAGKCSIVWCSCNVCVFDCYDVCD